MPAKPSAATTRMAARRFRNFFAKGDFGQSEGNYRHHRRAGGPGISAITEVIEIFAMKNEKRGAPGTRNVPDVASKKDAAGIRFRISQSNSTLPKKSTTEGLLSNWRAASRSGGSYTTIRPPSLISIYLAAGSGDIGLS